MPIPKPMANEDHDKFMERCMSEMSDEKNAGAMCETAFKEHMKGKGKTPKLIAISAPVTITAGEAEGEKKGPAKFQAEFYTGGALNLDGWDLPVVVDLAGLESGKVLVANLDHDRTKRVGNFAVANDGRSLVANGTATAKTAARDEVIGSAAEGYQWQASLEANPRQIDEVKKGKTVEVNGQSFTGPLYVARLSTLKGFAFVSHGADDNTTVTIAATAASTKGKAMDAACKTWIEAMGLDVETLSEEQLDKLEANYKGENGKKNGKKPKAVERLEAREADAQRADDILDYADGLCEKRRYDRDYIKAIRELATEAIEANWSVEKFRLDAMERGLPVANFTISGRRNETMSQDVLEAAVCSALRLDKIDDKFDDKVLDAAHKKFKDGIGLSELVNICAEFNGYRGASRSRVTLEAQRAAFGMSSPVDIKAQGWSTIEISSILSNVANKFLMEAWNAVDMTPLRIASIRPVQNFLQTTTVSLVVDSIFEKVGAAGEIPHGEASEVVYTNKADTYAKMLAITRQDIMNDNLGALSAAPRKLGRGAALKLNDIFWTEFLAGVSTNFFGSTNANINAGAADMTIAGLTATEVIFMNQTNPDGSPLGLMPAILLVPTALKAAALNLMNSEKLIDGTATAKQGDGNVFRGRFRVESSPYISNSAYTGNTSQAWWMLANPSELATIEIVAVNGRIEPVVDTAEAAFNVLGMQMRAYADVGVNLQEYRAGVHADGNAS